MTNLKPWIPLIAALLALISNVGIGLIAFLGKKAWNSLEEQTEDGKFEGRQVGGQVLQELLGIKENIHENKNLLLKIENRVNGQDEHLEDHDETLDQHHNRLLDLEDN